MAQERESDHTQQPGPCGTGESPCLIGLSQGVSDIPNHPRYYHPHVMRDGSVVSVDNVRLGLRYSRGEWLSEFLLSHADLLGCDWTYYPSKLIPGRYFELYRFELGESSVSLGLGHVGRSCKPDFGRGFLELNPSKVAQDDRLSGLLDFLSESTSGAVLKRFDLALDVERDRNELRLTKDRRAYGCIMSQGALSEYLGQRNAPGFVRLYSKSAEAGLPVPLTRIEMVTDGGWDSAEVLRHWPEVHGWRCGEDSRGWTKVVGMLISEKVERGEEVETYIGMLGRDAKKKVRDVLRTPPIALPEEGAQAAIDEAHAWCYRLAS